MSTFKDSFSEEVWKTTYKNYKDSSVSDTFRRVAHTIASVEATDEKKIEWENKFYDMLTDFKVLSGGRITANAGTEWKGTTFMNCYVGPLPDQDLDSIEGIYAVLLQQALTLKSEGGWGMDFSWIRPRGSFISGIGVESPGAIKFLELFDKSSEIVTAGSGKKNTNSKSKEKIRKGAQLCSMTVSHPDIIEFITAKQTSNKLSKFNMSVNCTDEFMAKVNRIASGDLTDDSWDLIFPDTEHSAYKSEWKGSIENWKAKGYPVIVHNTVKVSYLWDLITSSTYNRNEPGVLFLDRANKLAPFNYGETILSTNPCVSGDTLVMTDRGIIAIRDLANSNYEDIKVHTFNTETGAVELESITFVGMTKKNARTVIVETEYDYLILCTPDHKIYTTNRGYVNAENLTNSDILVVSGGTDRVAEVRFTSTSEDVYDLTTTNNHNFFANGILVHNCGEQVLAPGGVCCLGTVNLTQFVLPDCSGFDIPKLEKYVGYLVRFLDNVNSISDAPLPEYIDAMRNVRRIGCGVMGWGSALFMLKTKFGSEAAAELRETIMKAYATAAYTTSIDLAIEKGQFNYCVPELHAKGEFVSRLNLPEEYLEKLKTTGIRNSSLLSQQPNGNGSIFANVVTGGIEPAFMTEYIRTVIVSVIPEEIVDACPKFHMGEFHETSLFKFKKEGDEEILHGIHNGTVYKIDKNRGLTKEVLCEDYGIRFLKEQGEYNPDADYIVTTTELGVDEHVSDMKGFAKWTDSSLSKTCNLPNDYSFADFKNLYLNVYNTGLIKGFTTYRAGTMTSVLSAVTETLDSEEEIILQEAKLPDSLPAVFKTLKAEGRKWYLTAILNQSKTKPVALFVHTNNHEKNVVASDALEKLIDLARVKGVPEKYVSDTYIKTGSDSNTTKTARAISLCLRHGILIRNIVSTLDKVDCFAGSFVFHIRKYLATFIKNGEKVENEKCDTCGSESVVYQEGCKVCANCGSSKCG